MAGTSTIQKMVVPTVRYGIFDISIILLVLAAISFNVVVAQANLVGDSMGSTIESGQVAFYFRILGPWTPENLTGQIVFVAWPEFWICHCCIGDNGTHIQTKGDGLQDPEPWVPKSQLRGVVLGTTSLMGSYADMGLLAGICLAAYVYFERKEQHEKKTNSVN